MIEFIIAIYRLVIGTVKYFVKNRFIKIWHTSPRPIVQVRQGQVCGITATLPNGKLYHYFKGIPYAKPPIGDLRFKPPVAIEKFYTPVVDCAVDRNEFIQANMYIPFIISGTEKALYLNVFTPKLPDEFNCIPPLPVMIFIHGGGYLYGSAQTFMHDPVHLVQEGVIVVVMNYRLGPFGFLSLPSMGVAGNAGLKDQVMAFKWVKENIGQFGGDAENVTIYGNSAGSWSAYLHYLSANSRKYFNRVICQSGVVCTSSFFQLDPEKKARKLAKILGYMGNSDQGVYDTLMRAPAHLLVKHQHDVANKDEEKLSMNFLFRPVIEQIETEDSIITTTPEDLLKQFDSIDMPLISGCTDSEGILPLLLMRQKNQTKQYQREPELLVPCFFRNDPALDLSKIGKKIKEFYFGNNKFNKHTKHSMCDLMSDNAFITTTLFNAELLAKFQPRVKHFHYRFTYHGRFSLFKGIFRLSDIGGACHGDDQYYIFNSTMLPSLHPASDEIKVRSNIVRLWANFAKYGHPTPSKHEDINLTGLTWPSIQCHTADSIDFNLSYININIELSVKQNPNKQRIDFWRQIISQYKKDLLQKVECIE